MKVIGGWALYSVVEPWGTIYPCGPGGPDRHPQPGGWERASHEPILPPHRRDACASAMLNIGILSSH